MNSSRFVVVGFALGLLAAVAPSCGGTKCSAATCSTGCCDAMGQCQQGNSNVACGQLGSVCQACSLGQSCNLGSCLASSTGGGSGFTGGGGGSTTGGGGGSTTGGGGGSTTGGGGGSTTGGGGGSMTGGGGGGSCDGCFFNGQCIARANSNNNTLCGQGGVTCATCSGSQTCQNYVCTGGTTGGGGGTTGSPIGGPCTSSANCQSGLTCKQTTATDNHPYPGGYCTKACTQTSECGVGAECLGGPQSTLQFFGEPQGFCLQTCPSAGSVSTCRANGYTCEFNSAGQPGVCWLDPIPAFNGGGIASNTGAACTSDTCQPAGVNDLLEFCLKAALPDAGFSGWTQGYCTADCRFDNTDTFCGTNGACVPLGAAPNQSFLCLQKCTSPGTRANCRSGYFCAGLQTGDSVCYPDCSITGCASGGTCNSTTGACM